MSGGSWDYCYRRVEEVSERLLCERDPLRRALGAHLVKVAAALHDIEWVDSADKAAGDEDAAIRAVVSPEAAAAEVAKGLRELIDEAELALKRLGQPR